MTPFIGYLVLSLVIFAVLSFAYIAVGAGGGFGGGGSVARKRGYWIMVIAAVYAIIVTAIGGTIAFGAAAVAAIAVFLFWAIQR
jgi:hypothetical protein